MMSRAASDAGGRGLPCVREWPCGETVSTAGVVVAARSRSALAIDFVRAERRILRRSSATKRLAPCQRRTIRRFRASKSGGAGRLGTVWVHSCGRHVPEWSREEAVTTAHGKLGAAAGRLDAVREGRARERMEPLAGMRGRVSARCAAKRNFCRGAAGRATCSRGVFGMRFGRGRVRGRAGVKK